MNDLSIKLLMTNLKLLIRETVDMEREIGQMLRRKEILESKIKQNHNKIDQLRQDLKEWGDV